MTMTRSSWTGEGESKSSKENMILKEYLWIDEAGKIGKNKKNELPKGWVKGKLLAVPGEISAEDAKAWGLSGSKAKAPSENKSK